MFLILCSFGREVSRFIPLKSTACSCSAKSLLICTQKYLSTLSNERQIAFSNFRKVKIELWTVCVRNRKPFTPVLDGLWTRWPQVIFFNRLSFWPTDSRTSKTLQSDWLPHSKRTPNLLFHWFPDSGGTESLCRPVKTLGAKKRLVARKPIISLCAVSERESTRLDRWTERILAGWRQRIMQKDREERSRIQNEGQ